MSNHSHITASLITDDGRAWIVSRMMGQDGTRPQNYIGWGTGYTPQSAGDTGLHQESKDVRVLGDISSPSPGVYRVVGTMTSGSMQGITEVGVFDSARGGNMLFRAVFMDMKLFRGDEVKFTLDTILY